MGQIQFDRKRPRQLVPDQRWIQRGLVLAVSGTSGGREIAWSSNGLIVNTRLGTISKAVRKPGAGGLYTGTQGTSVMKKSIATSAVNGSEFITLVTTAAPSTLANEIRALGFANDGGAALFNLEVSSAGIWRLQIRNNASVALNLAGASAAVGRADTIVGRVSGYGGEAAVFTPSGKATGTCPSGPIGINTISVGFLDRNSGNIIEQGWEGWLGDQFVFDKALTDRECFEIQADPACLWRPPRIWVPVSAGGAATHDTTCALVGSASVIAGTAAHIAAHGTSGALAGAGASTVGSAARTREHATTGVAVGAGGVVSGTAVHNIPHPTSGALAGAGAVTAGSAARATSAFEHATSGALTGAGATVAGTAARVHEFGSTGALAGAGGVVAGTAAHVAIHGTSGVLAGDGGQLSGTAAGSGAAVAVGLAGGFDVDYEPTLWWQRKPKRIKPEEAKQALQAVAKVVKEKAEEHAAELEPVAQRRADVKQAVAPLVSQMPGFDWRPIYDEAYDRALTAAIAQQMREQEAAQQMEQAVRRARLIDDEEVALLAAML